MRTLKRRRSLCPSHTSLHPSPAAPAATATSCLREERPGTWAGRVHGQRHRAHSASTSHATRCSHAGERLERLKRQLSTAGQRPARSSCGGCGGAGVQWWWWLDHPNTPLFCRWHSPLPLFGPRTLTPAAGGRRALPAAAAAAGAAAAALAGLFCSLSYLNFSTNFDARRPTAADPRLEPQEPL